ncbi:MAG TPA: hypothetical protein VE196_13425, partial [Pseudonocardiaceae bacterium]|nr:hypothetical protein [Pseudonocardiaceae bacterium]
MRRTLRWGFAALCYAAVFAVVWWLCQAVLHISQSDAIAIAGAVAALALAPFTSWADLAWFVRKDDKSERDRLTDRLAGEVYHQWTQAAAERGLLHPDPIEMRWNETPSVAGSAQVATDSSRFTPIPGLAATRREQLRQGELRDLHAIYGGLGSGRLVIVGPPGSGKSGAAVLLLLAALKHRNAVAETERAKVPVPVLFTLAGWDPSIPLRDWLVSQLRQTYEGLFTGRRGARAA